MNGDKDRDEFRNEMAQVIHKARVYSHLLRVWGLAIAFISVVVITYLWLFYNP